MNTKSAMVVGATGLIGNELLNNLLDDDHYGTIVSVSRKDPGIENKKLVKLLLDFDQLDDVEDLLEATHIFCCLGTTMKKAGSKDAFRKVDYEYVLKIAQLARKNKVEQFSVVSSLGANPGTSNFYLKTKGEVEADLSKLDFKKLNIFRPSLLTGNRQEKRSGEKIAEKTLKTFSFALVGPLQKYKPIGADVVAVAMQAEAKKENEGVSIYESPEIAKIGNA